jgi:gp178
MKPGDKVILLGFIDGCSYETTGQTNFIIALETGERVEVPIECVIKKEQVVKKDEIKLKDVIRRINRLDENSKTYWLDTILNWFSLDFGLTKYRQGYEKGKLEGEWVGQQLKDADKIRQELNKPVVPHFVADWYEENKDVFEANLYRCAYNIPSAFDSAKLNEFERWFLTAGTKPFQTLVNMHQFGYEVEKEKQYLVKVKGVYHGDLGFSDAFGGYSFYNKERNLSGIKYEHTRKELEADGFGWVFDCEGVEVEEVEE